jgi:hypothetical protein
MQSEQPQTETMAQSDEGISGDGGRTGPRHLSRRQAIGHMSAVAAAGAVAWAVPEILTAKPAAGATLSNPIAAGASTSGSTAAVGTNGPDGEATAAAGTPTSLAFTGLNIQRDAEVGAALVAGGWAMQHWASRAPKPAGTGSSAAHQPDGAT